MGKKRINTKTKKKVFKHKFNGSLSLVIPCYREGKRINKLFDSLKKFDALWENSLEIIIVDDGSTDDTVKKIENTFGGTFSGDTTFELLQLGQNQGKGAAITTGVEKCTGDFILTIDADMAVDPSTLLKWLQTLEGNTFHDNEILIGSREHENSKIKGQSIRRVAGLIFNFIIQLFTNLNLSDTQCGFKLYLRDIAKSLFAQLKTKGWAHDIVLEHIQDDYAILEDIKTRLGDNAHFFITVPAFMSIWSSHDVYLGHYRRYTIPMLNKLLTGTKCKIDHQYYIYGFIFPLVWLVRRLKKNEENMSNPESSDLKPLPGLVNFILKKYNSFEMNFRKMNKLFGLTCVAEGRLK